MDKRDEFFDLYFKYNSDKNIDKEKVLKELTELANSISSLKGWPEDKEKFWDVESYYWSLRFKGLDREFVIGKVNEHVGEKHLDLASGALPVNDSCVCLDLSPEMLDMIRTDQEKVQFDIDSGKSFPFENCSFDSVSCVFILNYIENLDAVVSEIYRVLKEDGKFIIVQSAKPLHELHLKQEKHSVLYFEDKLMEVLEDNNFFVQVENYENNGNEFLFLVCNK